MRPLEHNTDNQDNQIPIINRRIVHRRKSSESDERQIKSLPDQIHTLFPYINYRDIPVIVEPMQESIFAKTLGKPLFDKLVQKIEDGEANGIVFLNSSRLSRNTVDTGRIIYLMDQGKLEEVVTPYQAFSK